MLTETDYCDYETCVALKELGYVGTSRYYYTQRDHKFHFDAYNKFYTVRTANAMGYVLAIHLYKAQKWLREEKGIIISPAPYENFKWCACIYCVKFPDELCKEFDSYEEALSEGLKEAVKILKDGNNN